MDQSTPEYDEPREVRKQRKVHFTIIYHDFLERWLPILTGSEVKVYLALEKSCTHGHKSTDGWFTLSKCCKLTSLHKDTVLKALDALRVYGILTTVPRNGKSSHHVINDEVEPDVGAQTPPRKWSKNLPRPGLENQGGPGLENQGGPGLENQGGPGLENQGGPGLENQGGPGLENHPPSYTLSSLRNRRPPKDDDDDSGADLPPLTQKFLDLGITLDRAMAKRVLDTMRQTRKNLTLDQVVALAEHCLPKVNNRKKVDSAVPYLLKCMVEMVLSPAWEKIVKRLPVAQSAEQRLQEEEKRLLEEQRRYEERTRRFEAAEEHLDQLPAEESKALYAAGRRELFKHNPEAREWPDETIMQRCRRYVIKGMMSGMNNGQEKAT